MLNSDAAEFGGLCPQDGDSAFWLLWQQNRDYLYRRCLGWMGGNPTEAEDALSRAMLKAWAKVREGVGARTNYKGWLTRLTHNLCVDIHRERNRSPMVLKSWDALTADDEDKLASQVETPVLAA